jgi:hypothetical protein
MLECTRCLKDNTIPMIAKRYALIAIAFFVFWSAVLYASADHPSPPGFLGAILLVAMCSLAVGLRMPAYR